MGPVRDGAWGSLASYGVRVPVGSGDGPPPCRCRSPWAGGCWTGGRSPADGAVRRRARRGHRAVPGSGRGAGGAGGRVALLVMGDGSARRSLKGPGDLRPGRRGVRQRGRAGAGRCRRPRSPRSTRSGRPAAGGGAGALAGAGRRGRQRQWGGAVTWSGSPYGVTYLVATWRPAGSDRRCGVRPCGVVGRPGCRRRGRRACPARSLAASAP